MFGDPVTRSTEPGVWVPGRSRGFFVFAGLGSCNSSVLHIFDVHRAGLLQLALLPAGALGKEWAGKGTKIVGQHWSRPRKELAFINC